MYTSVYFHKTVRIAEMMLCKAVEAADDSIADGLQRENDASLVERLVAQGGRPKRIVTLLRYRQLYKRAYSVYVPDMSEEDAERLLPITEYRRRKSAEAMIADRAGVDPSEVILDVPSRQLITGEVRQGRPRCRYSTARGSGRSPGSARSARRYSPAGCTTGRSWSPVRSVTWRRWRGRR